MVKVAKGFSSSVDWLLTRFDRFGVGMIIDGEPYVRLHMNQPNIFNQCTVSGLSMCEYIEIHSAGT